MQAYQEEHTGGQPEAFSNLCCHSCRCQVLPVKTLGKAAANHVSGGSLLDPSLMPPYIQQNAQQNLAALQLAPQHLIDSQKASTAAAGSISSTDSLRKQIAKYLID